MMDVAEIAAVILGLLSVYLVTRQNVLCYPLGIVSVFLYIFIFYEVKLYADMGLQFFFIALQVYGWYEWLHGGKDHDILNVSWANPKIYFAVVLFVVPSTAMLSYLLQRYTDASVPVVDSLLAVLSMAGQWMMAKKYIENWIMWTIVNIGSIAMFGYKGLYVTMILYCVYLVLGVLGFFTWKRSYLNQRP